jgi:U1 small nuclear ribonucleoprotein
MVIVFVWNRNPYRTLFVGRLSYDTTEKKLRREFEAYGPIKQIRLVTDSSSGSNKSRGYAFIEFVNESDMAAAYKKADGNRIDDRRIVVDVERGR